MSMRHSQHLRAFPATGRASTSGLASGVQAWCTASRAMDVSDDRRARDFHAGHRRSGATLRACR
jgi:hypothetical protein